MRLSESAPCTWPTRSSLPPRRSGVHAALAGHGAQGAASTARLHHAGCVLLLHLPLRDGACDPAHDVTAGLLLGPTLLHALGCPAPLAPCPADVAWYMPRTKLLTTPMLSTPLRQLKGCEVCNTWYCPCVQNQHASYPLYLQTPPPPLEGPPPPASRWFCPVCLPLLCGTCKHASKQVADSGPFWAGLQHGRLQDFGQLLR